MTKKMYIIMLIAILLFIIIISISIFTSTTKQDKSSENISTDESNLPIATIKIKDFGTMTFKLFPDKAPQSVYNFISLANSGFYDGLSMHRIIPDFVAQGGDPDGNGTGGPGYSIEGEFTSNGSTNDLTHQRGALAWARSAAANSAGSQFYICLDDLPSLDGQYAVFGYMESGEDVLDKLQEVGTSSGTPTKSVTIDSISVDTKGVTYPEPTKIK